MQDLKNPSRGRARQLAAVNLILHIFHTHRKQDGESSNRPLACVHSSAGSTIRGRAGIPNSVDTNVLLDGAVGRLYENGTEHRIRFARSELEWLAGGISGGQRTVISKRRWGIVRIMDCINTVSCHIPQKDDYRECRG